MMAAVPVVVAEVAAIAGPLGATRDDSTYIVLQVAPV